MINIRLSPAQLSAALLLTTLLGCQQQPKVSVQPHSDDADRSAAFQQQQAAGKAQAQHAAQLNKEVEANKKKSRSFNVGGSKTWQTYIP